MSYLIARTLTACVEGVGPAMGGLVSEQYKIVKFHLGHEPLLVDVATKTVQAMPLARKKTDPGFTGDLGNGTGVFYTRDLQPSDMQWSNGKLLIKCVMPATVGGVMPPGAEMPDGVAIAPYNQSTLYLEDSNGNLSHALVKLPDFVLPESGTEVHCYIEFPINTTG